MPHSRSREGSRSSPSRLSPSTPNWKPVTQGSVTIPQPVGRAAPTPTSAPTAIHQSSAPGLMGTFASTVAGSVIGHGIASMLFRRDQPVTSVENTSSNPCLQFDTRFQECLRNNNGGLEHCQVTYDSLMECRRSNNLQ